VFKSLYTLGCALNTQHSGSLVGLSTFSAALTFTLNSVFLAYVVFDSLLVIKINRFNC